MNNTEPDRLTSPAAAEAWARGLLGPDHYQVHSDLPGWIEVALRVTAECCTTAGDPGPAFAWLVDRLGHVDAIGYRPAPCPVCGQHGANWITTGPFALTPDETTDTAKVHKRVDDLHLARRDRRAGH